jgi:predicted GNAT superfamily acetyltransferase
VRDLYTRIWGRGEEPVVTAELLRVLAFVGGYVHGAFAPPPVPAGPHHDPHGQPDPHEQAGPHAQPDSQGDGSVLVGAAVALPTIRARSPRAGLHSHVTGAVPHPGTGGVGFALKLDQRAWALERGLREITWTFDPLVRRNAHVNLAKLAADPVAYLVDFYGEMGDDINVGQGSDRLLVRWELAGSHVAAACSGVGWVPPVPPGAETALAVSPLGEPLAMAWPAGAPALLVQVPPDIEGMRRIAPELALSWRHAVRDVLAGLMADGWAVAGFVERSAYLLRPDLPGGPG